MVKRCSVPNCKSGLSTCGGEKITLFLPPKDIDQCNKWSEILGFSLGVISYICEKHFNPDDIKREDIVTIDGRIAYRSALKKVVLKKGALPISNYNEPIAKRCRTNVDPTEQSPIPESNVKPELNIQKLDEEFQKQQKEVYLSTELESVIYSRNDNEKKDSTKTEGNAQAMSIDGESHEISQNSTTDEATEHETQENLFQGLITKQVQLKLPSTDWAYHLQINSEKKTVVFSEMNTIKTPTHGKNDQVVLAKKIFLDQQLYINIVVCNNHHVELSNFQNPKTQEELECLLDTVDKLTICCGGPKVAIFKNIHCRCAYKDELNCWRHNSCPIVIQHGKICKFCASLEQTFRSAYNRQIKRRVNPTRLFLSPSTKRKVGPLYTRSRVQAVRLLRKEKQLINLKQEIANNEQKMKNIQEQSLQEIIKEYKIPEPQVLLIRECITMAQNKSQTNNRYNDEWLLWCLLLYIRNSTTYNFLRNNGILPLPAKSTISRYLRSANTGCGFDENFFKLFKKQLTTLSVEARHGILTFDEVQVRSSIEVNVKNLEFDGVVDYGNGNAADDVVNHQADHALVFMFSSLMFRFHQPIAMFACKGATPARVLGPLILRAIMEIEKAGGKVHGIVSDGASTNRSTWTDFGISEKLDNVSHFFPHPIDENRVIYAVSDAPHLIKCIRNLLFSRNKLKISGEEIRWQYYRELFEEDTQHNANLRACPSLTINHINPTNFAKMRVSYATQIFSRSVAAGLKVYLKQRNSRFNGCEATIKFTEYMNDLFHALNRKHPAEGIRLVSNDFKILEEAIKWLDNWEREVGKTIHDNDFLSRRTAQGLRVTLHSVIDLSRYLLKECGFKYVLTAKMNQDCLEQFFGIIRQAGCQNDHPTLPTFTQLFHLLSSFKILKPPKFGNCKEQTMTEENKSHTLLEEFKQLFAPNKQSFTSTHIKTLKEKLNTLITYTELEADDIFDHDYTKSTVTDCIIYYVTGFVCKKILQKTTCADCRKALESDNSAVSTPSDALLVDIKSRGKLIHPTKNIYSLLFTVEQYIMKYIESNSVYNSVIDAILEDNVKFHFSCNIHKADILVYCIHYYITLRMRQFAKQENRKTRKISRDTKKKAKLTKS